MSAPLYCTVEDVVNTAWKYRDQVEGYQGQEFDNANITESQIETLIAEASNFIRTCLVPRYDVAKINDYSPDFPPIVVSGTKIQAAILLYQRFGSPNIDVDSAAIKALSSSLAQCQRAMLQGTLQDTLGNYIPANYDTLTAAAQDFDTRECRYRRYFSACVY